MSTKSDNRGRPLAVALRYDGTSAPVVTAKGEGFVAEEILRLAQEHDIPVRDEPDLVRLLAQVHLGEEIPRSLYVAVAQVIAFAYMLKGKAPPTQDAGEASARPRLSAPE